MRETRPRAPVVDPGGAGMGVAGQILDVLQRHVLTQQVRDHQDPERVGREDLRQSGRRQAPLVHQGIERYRMAGAQDIEEAAQGRQELVPGRRLQRVLVRSPVVRLPRRVSVCR